MSTLNPINTMHHIRDTYLRYLKTSYPFQNQELRSAFSHALESEGRLVKGPLLEAAPPFAISRSIAQLVEEGILHSNFQQLCSDAMPWQRPLYHHQDQAITRIVQHHRNLIIATGTGSGKTETFLIPILHHLLQEEASGTLCHHGVRALLLYPMNALANDQLKRLRRILVDYPTITFGHYTGETEEDRRRAESRFYEQFPHEPLLPNELISRQQMRLKPPHILLTNYAMLEYLLLRPEDCEFFDGNTGKHWRFIVLDEAHIYDGASGIELAMLLRRLKDRIVTSESGRLCCIATSATLGRGRDDFLAATQFASKLFNERFEWDDDDSQRQDVVEAVRLPTADLGEIWGEGSPECYTSLQEVLTLHPSGRDDVAEVLQLLAKVASHWVPLHVVDRAHRMAQQSCTEENNEEAAQRRTAIAVEVFLYHVLCGDARLHQLHEHLGKDPYFLDEIAHQIFPHERDANSSLVTLVDLAVRARPTSTSISLLPARYHAFARALEGVFVCLNAQDHSDGQLHMFLDRHQECPDCKGWVVELATCVRCGAAYLVGRGGPENSQQDSQTQHCGTLRQLSENALSSSDRAGYFLLDGQAGNIDEDEVVAAGDELEEEADLNDFYTLCLRCGSLALKKRQRCSCGGSTVPLRKVSMKNDLMLRHCIHCGAHSSSSLVSRFLTGQDAPVSVLATALYQQLPSALSSDAVDLPGEGRKLLIFSDNRQDAAFFAPYLERTYNQVLHRRLILSTLLGDSDGRLGSLRMQDVVSRLLRQADNAGVFTHHQSRDEQRRIVSAWLMQELVTLNRRLSLEGMGLLQFRLVRPKRWHPLKMFQEAPWHLSEDESWILVAMLLETLRQQGVTTFPDFLDPKDEEFAPRNKALFVRKEQSDSKAGILSWIPTRGSNRRLNLLDRLLRQCLPSLTPEQCLLIAKETLSGLWNYLTEPGSCWRDHLVSENRPRHGVVHRLSHEFWELVPLKDGRIYRCDRCRAYASLNLRDLCPTHRCEGRLQLYTYEALEQEENHYRALYLGMQPIPLAAEEHTAQWTSDEAGKVQERFIRGEVNVLSCSTTFELGVDVGELQAVLMRNVPPTTANYIQRAGRAGRRTDSAAFALTYAQRRSHDFTHYTDPKRIVAGRVNPPKIMLANEKIVRRHMQAVLLASFFRYAYDQKKRGFRTIGDFFQSSQDQDRGTELLMAFAQTKPGVVQEALKRIVPAGEMQKRVGIEDWAWLHTGDGDGMLDLLKRVDEEVVGDLKLYSQLEAEAANKKNYGLCQHYQRVIYTICSRSLLGLFASRNLLPKYGFPVDVVELKTDHLSLPEASKVQLERDLRIAIAEYAPGAEVVAAKRIWTGGGLYKQPKRDWPIYHYVICPRCKRFIRSLEDVGTVCIACGNSLNNMCKETFVIPEFGFVAARDNIRTPGESRPQRLHTSRVYFAEYARPQQNGQRDDVPTFKRIEALSSKSVQVSVYYSRFGKLALVNEGPTSRGFRICQWCGFAEMAPEHPAPGVRRRRSRPEVHVNPRSGKLCNGFTQTHHLGHEFLTDVVELHFNGQLAMWNDWKVWRSMVYALLEGSSHALGIRRDDLDGTFYTYSRSEAPAIVLFDNVPGGAGHVKRVAEELVSVFKGAYQRVDSNCCGAETSCYECLRNYRNQPYHDELQRGLARDFLHQILNAAGLNDLADKG